MKSLLRKLVEKQQLFCFPLKRGFTAPLCTGSTSPFRELESLGALCFCTSFFKELGAEEDFSGRKTSSVSPRRPKILSASVFTVCSGILYPGLILYTDLPFQKPSRILLFFVVLQLSLSSSFLPFLYST